VNVNVACDWRLVPLLLLLSLSISLSLVVFTWLGSLVLVLWNAPRRKHPLLPRVRIPFHKLPTPLQGLFSSGV
jgi:hypothetical protein